MQFIAAIIGGILVYVGQKAVNRANATAVDVKTFGGLVDKVSQLSTKVNSLDRRSSAYLQYIYALLEYIRQSKGIPPLPPIEMEESDPELMRVVNELRGNVTPGFPKVRPT